MLEIVAQPGQSPGINGDASLISGGYNTGGRGAQGTFIGSTFDGYAASFNGKGKNISIQIIFIDNIRYLLGGAVDYTLRDPRNLRNTDMWHDSNADSGFINNNVRVVSKRNLRVICFNTKAAILLTLMF